MRNHRGASLTRLWTIVEALRAARRGLTAAQLLQRTGASRATIYRDLSVLRASGVPVDKRAIVGEMRYVLSGAESARAATPLQLAALLTARRALGTLEDTRLVRELDALIRGLSGVPPTSPAVHYPPARALAPKRLVDFDRALEHARVLRLRRRERCWFRRISLLANEQWGTEVERPTRAYRVRSRGQSFLTRATTWGLEATEYEPCFRAPSRSPRLQVRRTRFQACAKSMRLAQRAGSHQGRADARTMVVWPHRVPAAPRNRRRARRQFDCRLARHSESRCPKPNQGQGHARESRCSQGVRALRRAQGRARCRRAALIVGRKRKLSLPHCFGRETQGLGDVLRLQVGVQLQDRLGAHAVGDHIHDHRHRNPEPANTGRSAHLIGTNRDARKRHMARLARTWRVRFRTGPHGGPRPSTVGVGRAALQSSEPPLYFPKLITENVVRRSDGPIAAEPGGAPGWTSFCAPSERRLARRASPA